MIIRIYAVIITAFSMYQLNFTMKQDQVIYNLDKRLEHIVFVCTGATLKQIKEKTDDWI